MHKGKLSGVLHKGFKPDKCKTALRMALARIKLLRNKKGVQVRQMRREVAQLLETNQDQTARIRVEHVIREEKFMQAYDLIEVYCELIVARMSIIDSQKTCPIDMKEAIASVIFASMRCSDVTELADVRKHFTSKYGKDFATAALEVRPDSGVNRLVIEKLSAGAPDVQSKTKTLSSIAEEHNIKWEPKAFEEKLQKENEDLAYGTATYSGGNIPTTGSSASSISTPQPASHSYQSAEVPANRTPYGAVNSNAFSQENIRGSNSSVPPSSQHGGTTYTSAEIPGPNNFSHGNTEGPNVSRPYSQYDAAVSDTPAGSKEFNQPRERKSSGSGSNWNVQFKDATSAAQAAAESAEMASIAARAAAQLASRGNFSAEQNNGAFESATYTRETTPRKQQAENIMKDYKRSFNEQSSGTNDPRVISRNARRDAEREETNLVDSQSISAPYSSAQFHSYPPESHSDEYGMPTEPHRAHSPESPYSDDSSEKEQHFGRPENHSFNSSRERFPDAPFGGHSIKDMESKLPSFGQENTNNYYSNYSSSHGTFTHGSSSIGDNQNNNTGADSSTVVFDQYDSDAGEDNSLDPFFSKHTEEPSTVQDHKGFSSADWSQQHKSESPVKHSTSTLFSGTETHPSYNLETNRKDSPHSYDNAPPTFDSDGASSDEEIATSMHVKLLRSHSRGSGYSESKEDRISGNVVDSVNKGVEDYDSMSRKKYQNASSDEEIATSMHVKSLRSRSRGSSYSESKEDRISGNVVDSVSKGVEDYDSMSRKKYQNAPAFDAFHKEQYGDTSSRSDYSSGDNNLSEEETVAHKLKGASSEITGANKNRPFSLGMQTSATSADYDEGDLGLNFGRLTPGLRNKLRQPPPYNKGPRDNMLPNRPVRKAPAIESVNSKENNTSSEQTRNTPKGSSTTKSSFDANYNSELNDMNQSPIAREEARSTMRRNYLGDDVERSSERSANAPNSMINQSSVGVHSSQELDHEKSGVGASREIRTRNARSYFDSDDSEEEQEQRQTIQAKWSREQMQSRRTKPTSDRKRDGHVRTGGQHADETERAAEPIEQRRESPVYSRVPVQQAPSKPVHIEHPTGRGKLQDAELNTSSVPGNEENTESSAETPKGSASTTAPSHVHPKLPTDYDSFTAHFMSLRANRR